MKVADYDDCDKLFPFAIACMSALSNLSRCPTGPLDAVMGSASMDAYNVRGSCSKSVRTWDSNGWARSPIALETLLLSEE